MTTTPINTFLKEKFGERFVENAGIDWNQNAKIDANEQFFDFNKNGKIEEIEVCLSVGNRSQQFTFEFGAKEYKKFASLWNNAAQQKWARQVESDTSPAIRTNNNRQNEAFQEKLFDEIGITNPSELTTRTFDIIQPAVKLANDFPNLFKSNINLSNADKISQLLRSLNDFNPVLAHAIGSLIFFDKNNVHYQLQPFYQVQAELEETARCSPFTYGFVLPKHFNTIFLNSSVPQKESIKDKLTLLLTDLTSDEQLLTLAHEAAHSHHLEIVESENLALYTHWMSDSLLMNFNLSDISSWIKTPIKYLGMPMLDTHIEAANKLIRNTFNYKWLSIDSEALKLSGSVEYCYTPIYNAANAFLQRLKSLSNNTELPNGEQFYVQWIDYFGTEIPVPTLFVESLITKLDTNVGEKEALSYDLNAWMKSTRDYDLCIQAVMQTFAVCHEMECGFICHSWSAPVEGAAFGMTEPYAATDIEEDVATLVAFIFENGTPPYTEDYLHNYIIAKKVNLLVDEGFLTEKYRQIVPNIF